MKAQEAQEIPQSKQDQVTPVIIKMGGGGLELSTSNLNSVNIESPIMPFVESKPGPTWKSSQSTSTGRITELTIRDGSEPVDYPIKPSDQLASVTINSGSAQFVVGESGSPTANDVLVLITSQIPFEVITREDMRDWIDSEALFPDTITSVVLRVGDQVIVDYKFTSRNPRLNINFNRN